MTKGRKCQEKHVKGFVGMDVGKRALEMCRIRDDGKIERTSKKTTIEGILEVNSWLNKGDKVALEAGNQAFRIAKMIRANGKCEVYVLNPGDLATIYQSLKKTDKEDALKLARLISRIPIEELPVVEIPSDEIEKCRRLLKEEEYWSKQITSCKNRLHSLFTQAGLTEVRKKDMKSWENREIALQLLEGEYREEGKRTHQHMKAMEETLDTIMEKIKSKLRDEIAYTSIAMSMPGIGPITSFALYSFIGDGRRFSRGSQVSYYTGLVPRVDCSGDRVRYGRITRRGANLLRRPLIQAAWALVRSRHGGALKEFYKKLYPRIGKKKAIVATARKMLEVFYAMITSGTLYNYMSMEMLTHKLSVHGIK